MTVDPAARTRQLAAAAAADPTGWEDLYAEAADGNAVVPWDREAPSALLAEWAGAVDGTGRRALVVGCGLGRDAEFLARRGFATTGFDISATAIATARDRHPDSDVDYRLVDLFDAPAAWRHGFDLVVECMNVQAMPGALRAEAIAAIPAFVAPGGTLFVVEIAAPTAAATDGPPWPLTRAELDGFGTDGLRPHRVDHLGDATDGRWRAEFTRPGA